MKLKKIASLALAGLMAVSMLAGCNTGSSDDSSDVVVNPSDTSVAGVVNDGQSAANAVKVTFTYDSDLESDLKQAIVILGTDAADTALKKQIGDLTTETYIDNSSNKFWDGTTKPDSSTDIDGETQTYLAVKIVKSTDATTEKAAMKLVANEIDELVAKLVERTASVSSGDKYYVYSYEGAIAMVSVTNSDNTSTYYFVYTVSQTATEKKA